MLALTIELGGVVEQRTLDHAVVVIGRGRACNVRLDHAALAPRHVRLELAGETVLVTPLEGEVRTGELLAGPTPVAHDTPIRIGDATIRVRPHVRDNLPIPPPARRHPLAPPHWFYANDEPPPARPSHSPDESALIEAVDSEPADPTARMIYADWLEQRGELARAELVRLDGWPDRERVTTASTAAWRAMVAAVPIDGCAADDCPRWWHLLEPNDDACHRGCPRCDRDVLYCGTTAEVRARIAAGFPRVPDLELVLPLDAARLETMLRQSVPSGWTVEKQREGRWWVRLQGDGVIDQLFGVTLTLARTVEILYGGTDAGPLRFDAPPTYTIAELATAGLDRASIIAWLREAFGRLEPREVGYS